MGIVRVEKNKNFTVMSNFHLRDKTLSLKAKGLLSTMLSLPDEWDYSIAGLVTLSEDGSTAVRTALGELEDHKYLTRRALRGEGGKIVDWEYTVYETPHLENPHVGKPVVENPHVENRPQINTKETSTKEISTKETNTKKENAAALPSDDIEKEFTVLWSLYPRKQGKSNAYKAYEKARKGHPELFEQVKAGIEAYIAYIKKTKTGINYIKHGATWFNQHCWEDDYTVEGAQHGQHDQPNAEDGYDWESIGITL